MPEATASSSPRPEATSDCILVAELDGRFWSAETAASFTGRVIGPFAESGVVRFRDYAYQGGDGLNGLAEPGERVEL